MKTLAVAAAALLALAAFAGAEESDLDRALRMEEEGRLEEAFVAYLGIDRMEHAAARGFRMRVASDEDFRTRLMAARRLVGGARAEPERVLPVLRSLLADENAWVRVEAAVSLLILGDREVPGRILEWLENPRHGSRLQTLEGLLRVEDGAKLAFAREALRAIADDDSIRGRWRAKASALLAR